MSPDLISFLQALIFWFEGLIFNGWGHHLEWLFSCLGPLDISLSLKGKDLTWNVDLEGRGQVHVLILFTQYLQSSFFSFKREGLDLKGLSLRERKFNLRETFSLGSDSYSP